MAGPVTRIARALTARAGPTAYAAVRDRFGYPALARRVLAGRRSGDGLTVAAGPFAGLTLVGETTGAVIAKVIGTYESELHAVVEEVVRTPYRTVVNVGCGEGYYLVGLARRMPAARFVGFDTEPAAQAMAARNAAANGVADRVTVRGPCGHADLRDLDLTDALLVVDCEGYERTLLDPAAVPGLAGCDLLVELHDLFVPGTTAALTDRFAASHRCRMIAESDRDPAQLPPAFRRWHRSAARMMSEHRPGPMTWGFWQAAGGRA